MIRGGGSALLRPFRSSGSNLTSASSILYLREPAMRARGGGGDGGSRRADGQAPVGPLIFQACLHLCLELPRRLPIPGRPLRGAGSTAAPSVPSRPLPGGGRIITSSVLLICLPFPRLSLSLPRRVFFLSISSGDLVFRLCLFADRASDGARFFLPLSYVHASLTRTEKEKTRDVSTFYEVLRVSFLTRALFRSEAILYRTLAFAPREKGDCVGVSRVLGETVPEKQCR